MQWQTSVRAMAVLVPANHQNRWDGCASADDCQQNIAAAPQPSKMPYARPSNECGQAIVTIGKRVPANAEDNGKRLLRKRKVHPRNTQNPNRAGKRVLNSLAPKEFIRYADKGMNKG
jgi:hypothetical protein